VIAALILALLYFTGRMKYRSMAPLQRPAGMWRPVPTPDCLYPTPTGLCKQPYHLEL
jgi:hypothetical protein